MKTLFLVPYAYINGKKTGENIKNHREQRDIYFKNLCVCLCSVKYFNPFFEVALITNTDVPDNFKKTLFSNGIGIYKAPFDSFVFKDNFKWSLAFYKLCAVKFACENISFDNLIISDTDVVCQRSSSALVTELEEKILMLDSCEALTNSNYKRFISEVETVFGDAKYPIHYNGGFFAANCDHAKIFINKCQEIYKHIIDHNIVFSSGDELISSIAAASLGNLVKNAQGYVSLFWTSDFRTVSLRYKFNPVCFLHLPDEKEDGFIKFYDYVIRRGKKITSKKIHRYFHLEKQAFKYRIKKMIGVLIHKYKINRYEE